MPNRYISNVEFLATLLSLAPNQLTYSQVLELLHCWRHNPNYRATAWRRRNGLTVTNRGLKIRRSYTYTQYLSYSPTRDGRYKRTCWDSTNGKYHLLPGGQKYVVPGINSIDELFRLWHTSHPERKRGRS